MKEIEQHINYLVTLAEKLLIEQSGEFYPLASMISYNKEFVPVSVYKGDDKPPSHSLIESYRNLLHEKLEANDISSYAIAYDCRTKQFENSEKTDAIAVEINRIDQSCITYFYPYAIKENQIINYEPWGVSD